MREESKKKDISTPNHGSHLPLVNQYRNLHFWVAPCIGDKVISYESLLIEKPQNGGQEAHSGQEARHCRLD